MFKEITLIDYRRPIKIRASARKHCGPYKWSPSKPMTGRGFYMAQSGGQMDAAGSTIDLRIEPANDHLIGSRLARINGYFCDAYGDETMQPIIARLPHSRGFLAGWTMGAGMCGALESTVWVEPEDAARAAHDMVERDAEREREAQSQELDA
jgi:hypothetical protein